MVAKYGDLGHCWSQFLKACLENDSLIIDESLGATRQQEEKCMQHLADLTCQCISDCSLPQQTTVKESSGKRTSAMTEEKQMSNYS